MSRLPFNYPTNYNNHLLPNTYYPSAPYYPPETCYHSTRKNVVYPGNHPTRYSATPYFYPNESYPVTRADGCYSHTPAFKPRLDNRFTYSQRANTWYPPQPVSTTYTCASCAEPTRQGYY